MPRPLAISLVLVAILAAWVRLDLGHVVLSWALVVGGLSAVIVIALGWARRVPNLQIPPEIEALQGRDFLSPEEEERLGNALRTWHSELQRDSWLEISRHGPGPLIGRRAAFYFLWSSFLVLAVLPPMVVRPQFLPGLPRFVIVLLPLAVVAMAVALALGIRDWNRARRSLGGGDHNA